MACLWGSGMVFCAALVNINASIHERGVQVISVPLRVVAFPRFGTSYNECFYQSLEAQGVVVLELDYCGSSLWKNLRRGDWVHLHWPSFGYSTKEGPVSLLRNFFRWVSLLLLIRAKGALVIWTAHNLLPHDRAAIPMIDVLGRHFLIALAKYIFVHGDNASKALVERFPLAKPKLVNIPHGNWIGYYPISQTKSTARAELCVGNSTFLFLFIGLCKPYKNLDGLIRSFRQLSGDVELIVAGKFQDSSYQEEIFALAQGDPRIRIIPGFIPDEMMQTYLLACDAVVVPYRDILTSGTAMLALSFGRPIVSVALGFLKDVVTEDVGILFAPDDPEGLSQALSAALVRSFDQEQIVHHAKQYTYDDAANLCVKTLSGSVQR